MDEYKVVSLFGAGSCQFSAGSDSSEALRALRRKVRKLYLKQLGSAALRALAAAGLVYVGLVAAASPWSHFLLGAGALLGVHTLLFFIRGHAALVSYYRARRYWLQAPGLDQDLRPVYVGSREENAPRRSA